MYNWNYYQAISNYNTNDIFSWWRLRFYPTFVWRLATVQRVSVQRRVCPSCSGLVPIYPAKVYHTFPFWGCFTSACGWAKYSEITMCWVIAWRAIKIGICRKWHKFKFNRLFDPDGCVGKWEIQNAAFSLNFYFISLSKL